MSLLAKIASLRQVNINAHAEIETLKETLGDLNKYFFQNDISEWRAVLAEIEALKLQLADNNGDTLSTHEHHREIKSLRHFFSEHGSSGAAKDAEDALKDEIKTLHAENKTLKERIDFVEHQLADEIREELKKELGEDAVNSVLKLELCEQALGGAIAQIKALKEARKICRGEAFGGAIAQIRTLSLSLADRNEEVKTLKDEVAVSRRHRRQSLAEWRRRLRNSAKRQMDLKVLGDFSLTRTMRSKTKSRRSKRMSVWGAIVLVAETEE